MLKYFWYTAIVSGSEYWKANTRQIRQKTSFSEYDSWVPIIIEVTGYSIQIWILVPGARLYPAGYPVLGSIQLYASQLSAHKFTQITFTYDFLFWGKIGKKWHEQLEKNTKTRATEKKDEESNSRSIF